MWATSLNPKPFANLPKNDDIRENENINLSLEEEFSNPTLDEDKDIMECDKTTLVL